MNLKNLNLKNLNLRVNPILIPIPILILILHLHLLYLQMYLCCFLQREPLPAEHLPAALLLSGKAGADC